jgi:hypothetical protein
MAAVMPAMTTSVVAATARLTTAIGGGRFATARGCRFTAHRLAATVITVMPVSAAATAEQPGVGLRLKNHQDGEHRRNNQHHSNQISFHQSTS